MIRTVALSAALVSVAGAASAQVIQGRIVARTDQPLPGPDAIMFTDLDSQLTAPSMAGGFRVGFRASIDSPTRGGGTGVFYRAQAGLVPVALELFPPATAPVGAVFDSWQFDAGPVCDRDELAFSGVRSELTSDGGGNFSGVTVDNGVYVSNGGANPSNVLTGTIGIQGEPALLDLDNGAVFSFAGGTISRDGATLYSGTTTDGFTTSFAPDQNVFDAREGIGFVFGAEGSNGSFVEGIWAGTQQGDVTTVATTGTLIPGFTDPTAFEWFGPPVYANDIAFVGRAQFPQQGVFSSSGGSLLTTLANTDSTFLDSGGFPASISNFGDIVSADGPDVAFTVNAGIHLLVADGPNAITRVLSQLDTITDGGEDFVVVGFSLSPRSFSNGNIVLTGTLLPADDFPDFSTQFEAIFIVDADGNGIPTGGCTADVNGDGDLTPGDFNAWILAFNSDDPACDQNGDGDCRPNDFNAWVLNFNAGC